MSGRRGTNRWSLAHRRNSGLALLFAMAEMIPKVAVSAPTAAPIRGLHVVDAKSSVGQAKNPSYAVDGDLATELNFDQPDQGISVLLDLGRAYSLERLDITNGRKGRTTFLVELEIGGQPDEMWPLLGRPVTLSDWNGSHPTLIPLSGAVARYVRLRLAGGSILGGVSEIVFRGYPNYPERHYLGWWDNVKRDVIDRVEFLTNELGVTDLWLDYVETALPQVNRNSGFAPWISSGALVSLQRHGVRYWLGEHAGLGTLINSPQDLRDDRRWDFTFQQMRFVYGRAKELGFVGLVLDAEDYDGVPPAIRTRYEKDADYVNTWAFSDEFGNAGMYYQRGLQFGKVYREIWRGPMIQIYEARMYAGKNDCQQGNYWWLKGIHDAGVEVWLATGQTYGAGNGEIAEAQPRYLASWFVRYGDFMKRAHAAYPFVARVLPGFHPWNTRLQVPNYLPKYFDQQLEMAASTTSAFWLYTEGIEFGGDPRKVLNRSVCEKYGVRPEQYLDVLRAHRH